MSNFKNLPYDPSRVIVSVGSVAVEGFADGAAIKVSRAEDAVSHKVGMDGRVCTTVSANRTGTITIELLQTSPSNKRLAKLFKIGSKSLMPVTVDISLMDLMQPGSGAEGVQCWLKKVPDFTRGSEAENVTWEFFCEELTIKGSAV